MVVTVTDKFLLVLASIVRDEFLKTPRVVRE
jgi:hypothetical protein